MSFHQHHSLIKTLTLTPFTSCSSSLSFIHFLHKQRNKTHKQKMSSRVFRTTTTDNNYLVPRRSKDQQDTSPDRNRIWSEPRHKPVVNRKVPVVYYLCRNGQLDHPHFMEVTLSSHDGLYLKGNWIKPNNLLPFPWEPFWKIKTLFVQESCFLSSKGFETLSFLWLFTLYYFWNLTVKKAASFRIVAFKIKNIIGQLIKFKTLIWFFSDVINRLNDLRGKGMASLYSWSSKR